MIDAGPPAAVAPEVRAAAGVRHLVCIAPMDGWFDPAGQDADLSAVVAEHREAADAVVLGRVTYQEFAGFWPHQTDDTTGISSYLDRVAKYVFLPQWSSPGRTTGVS